MSAVRTMTPGWVSAPLRLPTVRELLESAAAARLFLDRQIDFWMGEIDPAWSLTERRARVVDVIDETPDVKTFVLAPGAAWPGHRAGQYVPVDVEVDGVRVRRCYSISSGASAPGARRIAITVKRVEGGRVSSFLHEAVGRGAVIRLGEPAGDFVLEGATPRKLLLLSGGSGVTPVASMLRDLSSRGAVDDVVFLHAARSEADVIFGDELRAIAAREPGLRLIVRRDDEGGGPLNEAQIRALVPDFAERATFLCGPPGMMAMVERVWAGAGALDRLTTERFGAPTPLLLPDLPDLPDGQRPTVRLRLSRAGRSVAGGEGSLLDQLERAGERPAFGCRMGICNTCRCHKRSGTVRDLVTGVTSSEPDQEIRLCVSSALTDLELAL